MTKRNNNKNINLTINTSNKRSNTAKIPRQGSIIPNPRSAPKYGVARFNAVCDPVVVSAFPSTPVLTNLTTDTGGNGSITIAFSPIGITGVNPTTSTTTQIESPHSPWLYSTSRNFGSFRVLRANLVVVGTVGSIVTGNVMFHSSRDYSDTSSDTAIIPVGGAQFDLATLAQRNKVLPLQVDTTWKKVSATTVRFSSGALISSNSINDLIFSSFTMRVNGGPVSATVCSFYVEYDIEFMNPMAVSFNG
jgi:hypothetical protein